MMISIDLSQVILAIDVFTASKNLFETSVVSISCDHCYYMDRGGGRSPNIKVVGVPVGNFHDKP